METEKTESSLIINERRMDGWMDETTVVETRGEYESVSKCVQVNDNVVGGKGSSSNISMSIKDNLTIHQRTCCAGTW